MTKVTVKQIEAGITRRIAASQSKAKADAGKHTDARRDDFSTIGVPLLSKGVPGFAVDYVRERGWTDRNIKLANLRFINGDKVAEIWPGSKQGHPTFGGAYILGENTKAFYWPLGGIVLPDTDDHTFATVRVFTEVQEPGIGDGPQKFRSPTGRATRCYRPQSIPLRDLYDPRKPLYIIEGPFKAALAALRGLLCIGVNGHSGVFESETKRTAIRPELHEYLIAGREVCFLTDADVSTNLEVRKSQISFMDVAATDVGCKPLYTELPDLGNGKTGADDYFAAGNTLADFRKLPRHAHDSKFVGILRCPFMDLTELGLSERFVAMAGEDCRHDPRLGVWYSYTASGYQAGIVEPHRRMIGVVKSLDAESSAAKDPGAIKARRKFQDACGKKNAVNAAVALAAMHKSLDIDAALFDAEQDLLGTPNGVLQLSTGKLLKPSPDLMVTKRIACAFDAKATAPLWMKFIHRICDGQRDMMSYLQEIAGACLAGRSARQEAFFLNGEGSNGKSVYLETLHRVLGDYAVNVPSRVLLKSSRGGNPEQATPFLITLHGMRLATCTELDATAPIDEAKLKDLNGGDMITGRANYGKAFSFRNTARILVRCNHLPTVIGTDKAVWDRIRIVPFLVRIPESEQDLDFGLKLAAELPGILAWAFKGLQRLAARANRFDTPLVVRELTEKHRIDSDAIGNWLTECMVLDPLKGASPHRELQAEITSSYTDYTLRNNQEPLSAIRLWRKIRERLGYEPVYVGDDARYAKGFMLKRSKVEKDFIAAQGRQIDKRDAEIAQLKLDLAAAKGDGSTTCTTPISGKKLFLVKGGRN